MADPQTQPFLARLLHDQVNRAEAVANGYAKLEHRGADHARIFIEEWARLAQATLSYSLELSDQWRRVSIEATRRTLEALTPRGG